MDKIKKIICVLFGHTRIVTMCLGYVYCGRCEEQIGDKLMSFSTTDENVVIGHNCSTCRSNYKKLKWHEKILTPNPFKENKWQKKK